jgi:protein-S-isoprenylcysteine O-methyltransferase Ste14
VSGVTATPRRPEAGTLEPRAALAGSGGFGEWTADLRYLVFGRVVPASLYALLGCLVVRGIASQVAHPQGGWFGILGGPVRGTLYAAFCLVPVALFVFRPRPSAAEGRLLPRVVAFVATTMLLALGVLPGGPLLVALPGWVAAAATLLLVAASVGEVWALLSLGFSFGIFPAARKLATAGPYRLVRHPLYLFESLCAVALLVPSVHLLPLAMVAAFVALQVLRLGYEETLLRRALPEWSAWARGRARLLPGVW